MIMELQSVLESAWVSAGGEKYPAAARVATMQKPPSEEKPRTFASGIHVSKLKLRDSLYSCGEVTIQHLLVSECCRKVAYLS
jgi:hypothetical protein